MSTLKATKEAKQSFHTPTLKDTSQWPETDIIYLAQYMHFKCIVPFQGFMLFFPSVKWIVRDQSNTYTL